MDLHSNELAVIDGRLSILHRGQWLPVPSGGDGTGDEPDAAPAGDQTADAPAADAPPAGDAPADGDTAAPTVPEGDAIQEATEDSLRETHAALDAHRARCRDRQDVAGVTSAMAEMDRIAAELVRRRDEAARVQAELADLDQQAPAALPEPAPVLAGAGASAAVLAGVRARIDQPGTGAQPPAGAPARPRAALQAAAGPNRGEEVDFTWIGQQLEAAKNAPEGQAILASVPAFQAGEGPEPLLAGNSIIRNDELIHEAQEDWRALVREGVEPAVLAGARTAAICGPFDIIRDIPDAFATDTPVADLFPSRPAGRGGWQYTVSGTLADVAGSVTLWNEASQAAVNPASSATWKPCATYVCPPTASATVEAIVQCVTYDNTLEMSLPERVRNLNNAVEALSARTYEGRLLQRIDALSHPFRFTGDYGALPALIEALNSLIPQLTYWNRQEDGMYDAILPLGVLNILGIDRANRAYGQEQQAGDVLTYIRDNVPGLGRIVVARDPSLGGEPGTFADPLPSVGVEAQRGAIPYISGGVYRIRLVDPGAAIYATTGEVNAGVLRDANMVRQNRTGYFTERFFMMEKNGPQPWANIDVKLCADGSRAGLVAPNGCLVS